MRRMFCTALALCGVVTGLAGCQHPSVSAVSLNAHHCDHHFAFLHDPCKEPEGIPFYLPKPLLIISKNFRNVEEAKVGLTDGAPIPNYYDDQAKYADLNARTNFAGLNGTNGFAPGTTPPDDPKVPATTGALATAAKATIYSSNGAPLSPGAVPSDGVKPEAFFTYHIIFVPDLTQKYGLKIKGGAGEIRAAMNLVNGWQFTGLGPYYMKDSSTAQNTLAGGISANLAASGVADVVTAVAGLKPGAAAGGNKGQSGNAQGFGVRTIDLNTVRAVADIMRDLNPKFVTIPAYAQISIYEPYLSPEGTMEWKLIAQQSYDRDVMTTNFQPSEVLNLLQAAAGASNAEASAIPATTTTPSPFKPPTTSGDKPPGDKPTEGGPGSGPSPGGAVPVGKPPALPTAPGTPSTMGLGAPPLGAVPTISAPPRADILRGAGSRPGGLNLPLLQTAPVGSAPARRSVRTLAANDAKADEAVVRTQGVPTSPPGPDPTSTAGMARLIAGMQTNRIKLSDTSAVDSTGLVTQSAFPSIDVRDIPAKATIELVRDGESIKSLQTGDKLIKLLSITDPRGDLVDGPHTYEVFATGPDKVRSSLGQIVVRFLKPLPPDTTDTQVPTQPPLTAGGAASTEATRQVLGMFPSILTKGAVAAPVVAPVPGAIITPVPTSGSQVTLNQFFGKTRVGNPALAAPPRKLSLFHRKEKARPSIRTLDVAGIDTDVAAVTAATTAAPGVISPPPKLKP